jgi:DNA-binding FrmR family transcriptional regulator
MEVGINKEIITALKKAHSHLGNVIRMVEEKEYCIDILQQNLAVVGLLKSANNKLLERHLNSCFVSAMRGTNEKQKQKMIDEILNISRLSR